jgi:hypothetical protein
VRGSCAGARLPLALVSIQPFTGALDHSTRFMRLLNGLLQLRAGLRAHRSKLSKASASGTCAEQTSPQARLRRSITASSRTKPPALSFSSSKTRLLQSVSLVAFLGAFDISKGFSEHPRTILAPCGNPSTASCQQLPAPAHLPMVIAPYAEPSCLPHAVWCLCTPYPHTVFDLGESLGGSSTKGEPGGLPPTHGRPWRQRWRRLGAAAQPAGDAAGHVFDDGGPR